MNVTCEGLINRLGYSCREVGEKVIAVQTPFAFADGEPINFYIDDSQELVTVHDNADTLAHLMGMGWNISDRRAWTKIKNIVTSFGFDLQDNGAIVGQNLQHAEFDLFARFISAMLAVVDWEREYLGLDEDQIQFIEEVEMYLRASDPAKTLTSSPEVVGHSGKKHIFHFDFAGTYVDAAKAKGISTGAILRKAADVLNKVEIGNAPKILVIMDDREEPEKVQTETDILSTMVSVMPFSVLVAKSNGTLTKH